MLERIHKVLARAGVAALRPAEDMVMAGRVTVNGRVVRELGAKVDPDTDVIAVDGNIITVPEPSDPHRYIMLNKPVDVISTAQDTHGRPTVTGLIPSDVRLFPVGRLDANSEGLILLTDDGDLAYRLTHPRFEVEKEYRVLLDRTPTIDDLRRWRGGVELEGEMTLPAWVEVLDRVPEGTWVRVVMREGRKRQIREIARVLGYEVLRLVRVREGPIALGDLKPGEWRELTSAEVRALQMHTRHIPSRESEERVRQDSQQDQSSDMRRRTEERPAESRTTPDRSTMRRPAPRRQDTPRSQSFGRTRPQRSTFGREANERGGDFPSQRDRRQRATEPNTRSRSPRDYDADRRRGVDEQRGRARQDQRTEGGEGSNRRPYRGSAAQEQRRGTGPRDTHGPQRPYRESGERNRPRTASEGERQRRSGNENTRGAQRPYRSTGDREQQRRSPGERDSRGAQRPYRSTGDREQQRRFSQRDERGPQRSTSTGRRNTDVRSSGERQEQGGNQRSTSPRPSNYRQRGASNQTGRFGRGAPQRPSNSGRTGGGRPGKPPRRRNDR
jgi:23S rRNA pseudouridine2605 synthase